MIYIHTHTYIFFFIYSDAGMDTSIDISEGKLANDTALTPTQPVNQLNGEINWNYEFHENHGRNIELDRKVIARRVASYNQGRKSRYTSKLMIIDGLFIILTTIFLQV